MSSQKSPYKCVFMLATVMYSITPVFLLEQTVLSFCCKLKKKYTIQRWSWSWCCNIIKLQSDVFNLALPLISLTHSGVWQVERFKALQPFFISPLLTEDLEEEEEFSGGLDFCQYTEQLSDPAWCHVGKIRRRRFLFRYPVWPPCFCCEDCWMAAKSYHNISCDKKAACYNLKLFYPLFLTTKGQHIKL